MYQYDHDELRLLHDEAAEYEYSSLICTDTRTFF